MNFSPPGYYTNQADHQLNELGGGAARTHQRTPNPGDLSPVERQYAHPKTRAHAEELIDGDVLRRRPADE